MSRFSVYMLKKIKFVKSALNNFFLGEIWQHCREDNRCQSISMVTHKNKYISIKLVTRLYFSPSGSMAWRNIRARSRKYCSFLRITSKCGDQSCHFLSDNCHGCCPLYKTPCLDEVVNSCLRIGFSSKEMISPLAHTHRGDKY